MNTLDTNNDPSVTNDMPDLSGLLETPAPKPVQSENFDATPDSNNNFSPKKKPFIPKKILIAAVLFFVISLPVLGIIIYNVSNSQQLADLRSRAACPTGQIFCGGCANGCFDQTKTCNQRIAECSGPQPTAVPPTSAPPGGSCTAGYLSLGGCCANGLRSRTYRYADCHTENRCDYADASCNTGTTAAPTSPPTNPTSGTSNVCAAGSADQCAGVAFGGQITVGGVCMICVKQANNVCGRQYCDPNLNACSGSCKTNSCNSLGLNAAPGICATGQYCCGGPITTAAPLSPTPGAVISSVPSIPPNAGCTYPGSTCTTPSTCTDSNNVHGFCTMPGGVQNGGVCCTVPTLAPLKCNPTSSFTQCGNQTPGTACTVPAGAGKCTITQGDTCLCLVGAIATSTPVPSLSPNSCKPTGNIAAACNGLVNGQQTGNCICTIYTPQANPNNCSCNVLATPVPTKPAGTSGTPGAGTCVVDNPSTVNSYISLSAGCTGQYTLEHFETSVPNGTTSSQCVGISGGRTTSTVSGPGMFTPAASSCGKCVQIDVNVNGTQYGTASYSGDCSTSNTPAPTATRTPTPSPVPQCGSSCTASTQCGANQSCSGGVCKLTSCVNNPSSCATNGCSVLPTNTVAIVPSNTPVVGQCLNIIAYKNGVQVNPSTLRAGDQVVFGINSTPGIVRARIRINGQGLNNETDNWTLITTKVGSEFRSSTYTLPTGTLHFVVEGQIEAGTNNWL